MSQKRILFISSLYPNPQAPNMAAFSRQQISALRSLAEVDVVAPVPWTALLRASLPCCYQKDGIEVYHPTYLYTPGICRSLYGHYFLYSVRRVTERLLSTREYDFIYASWLFPDGWAAARLAQKYQKPLFVKIAGTDVNRLSPGTAVTKKSLWVVDKANGILSVSGRLKEHLSSLGADPAKIEVVRNGVDQEIFHPMDKQALRQEYGVPAARKVILYVGNLKRDKGVLELADAFSLLVQHHPHFDLELVVIGTGPLERHMRQRLNAGGVTKYTRFLGSRSLQEVARWMNLSDLLCLPTYMEGQPNVVMEALACQTPVVASNVGGIPELDEGQASLRLIEPHSVPQLEKAVVEMLSTSLRPFVSSRVQSWQENAATVLDIFQRDIARSS